jgi:hypothetical protein
LKAISARGDGDGAADAGGGVSSRGPQASADGDRSD